MKVKLVLVGLCISFIALAQWTPQQTEWYYPVPEKVAPDNKPGAAPSDAVVLFDGTDLSEWSTTKVKHPAGLLLTEF